MFVSPMLLEKSNPVNSPDNIAELKFDGIRMLYSTMGPTPRLYTRHNNEITDRFLELVTLELPQGMILDGELIALDDLGKPDFEEILKRFMSKKKLATRIQYCVFDILYYKGQSVMNLPLWKRKELLSTAVADSTLLVKSRQFDGMNAENLFDLCVKNQLEGIVIKAANSPYLPGQRSSLWKKSVHYSEAEVYIAGYRKGDFGWLIGIDNRIVGTLEFGVPAAEKKAFYEVSKQIKLNETEKYVYIQPERIWCTVKYRNWTNKGLMRIPVFEKFLIK